jgi:tRNA dimethylallyltransferase
VTTRHLALVGPTASGKSDLALGVAATCRDVEIVSVDSMQVYRGLDIGTAKPTARERAAVPHHMIDVAEPAEHWSVARFQSEARAVVADIEARGKRALLVGGTGLYVRAVVDPLTFPPEDLAVRADVAAAIDSPDRRRAAYEELVRLDPDAAARIDPGNTRRITRALEVVHATGARFSSFGPGLRGYGPPVFPVSIVGVWLPRTQLVARIRARIERMRAAGLVEEVRALAEDGRLSCTARQAIGYKEVLAHLEGREPSLSTALEEAERRTRSLARRQRMWFRRDPRVTWLATVDNPCALLPALLAIWDA